MIPEARVSAKAGWAIAEIEERRLNRFNFDLSLNVN